MKVKPDGSLCLITSSARNFSSDLMIIKIEDENTKKISYKLISLKEDEICSKKEPSVPNEILNTVKAPDITDDNKEDNYQSKYFVNRNRQFNNKKTIHNKSFNRGRGKRHTNSFNRTKQYSTMRSNCVKPAKDTDNIEVWMSHNQAYSLPEQYPSMQNFQQPPFGQNCTFDYSTNFNPQPKGLLGDTPYSPMPSHYYGENVPESDYYGSNSMNYSDFERPNNYQICDRPPNYPDCKKPIVNSSYLTNYSNARFRRNWRNRGISNWNKRAMFGRNNRRGNF